MKVFLLNILLAFSWMAINAAFDASSFITGWVLSYFILWFVHRGDPNGGYFTKLPQLFGFAVFFIWEVFKANMVLAYDIVTPHKSRLKPGIIAIPLDVATDAEITLLATMITLTPGTLTMDLSEDRNHLYIHAMYIEDPEVFRRNIKSRFERRVKELFK